MSTKPYPGYDPRQQNPYADLTPAQQSAPQPYAPPYGAQNPVGIWARGDMMIFHKQAVFPDICLKSGKPAGGSRFKQNLSWFPPWIVVTLFVAWIIFLILALIMTKKAKIDVGVLPEFKQRRRLHMGIGLSAMFVAIFCGIGGIAWAINTDPDVHPAAIVLMIGGLLGFLASLIYLNIAPRLFKVKKITDFYVYLQGIHPDVIKQLPQFPFAYDP